MAFSKILITLGSVTLASGILFTAQSHSLVGPESSFMYRNPEWTVNGGIIAAVGVVIIAVGIISWIKRKGRKLRT